MPARVRVDRLKTIYAAAKHLNFAFRNTDYPAAPFQNGVSAYFPQIHRLTIQFCKQAEDSVGVRNFIEHSLVDFAKENPTCAIYVMPARQTTPTLRAEYANGRMVHVHAKNLTHEQVSRYVNYLRTRSGLPQAKFLARQTAHCKSIQGMWSPVLFRDPKQNAAELPDPEFSKPLHDNKYISATDYIFQTVHGIPEDSPINFKPRFGERISDDEKFDDTSRTDENVEKDLKGQSS